jgi:hypothetical protein
LGKYAQAQWSLLDPASGKRHQLTLALRRGVGMRHAKSQPIRSRRLRLFWMGVEDWLRHRVNDGRDNIYREIVLVHSLS